MFFRNILEVGFYLSGPHVFLITARTLVQFLVSFSKRKSFFLFFYLSLIFFSLLAPFGRKSISLLYIYYIYIFSVRFKRLKNSPLVVDITILQLKLTM